MSDPEGTQPSPDFSQPQGGDDDTQQARTVVRAVAAWYSQRLMQERRAPAPDTARIEELKGEWERVQEDLKRLPTASPEETARLSELYAARYRELTGR